MTSRKARSKSRRKRKEPLLPFPRARVVALAALAVLAVSVAVAARLDAASDGGSPPGMIVFGLAAFVAFGVYCGAAFTGIREAARERLAGYLGVEIETGAGPEGGGLWSVADKGRWKAAAVVFLADIGFIVAVLAIPIALALAAFLLVR